ncbi:serine protease 27 [Etheostoma spectabile]|uniref:Peptidase S1 domain-containing protein n=1 Tax=Etheostoma spectabile TaxID=54343 RepID=A0A5J5CLW0_9PERO|nr:serine protease 27-like [Etheostoma spectabile]KAA8582687.1 hypothetical protein FQN60_006358 [Etheostoma spectabile]
MALYQLLWGSTVMIVLFSRGCNSQPAVCGRAVFNTRIVGGQDALPRSWPWQVSLQADGSHFCGGSLITDQWVLTAAHCLKETDLGTVVHLGVQSLSGPNLNAVSRNLSMIRCHPSYVPTNVNRYDNDICLLQLLTPVTFTDYIQPICLASENSTFNPRVESWVTGFGVTDNGTLADILQEVAVPIVGNNECRCHYGDLTQNMMCAGVPAGGKDSCQGDSGGPLVAKKGSVWIQGGIVSYGESCGLPRIPGVYTRVSQYQDWINSIITGSSTPGFVDYISLGFNTDQLFRCPATPPPPPPPPTTDGNSVFDSGESMIHFSLFPSLCLLVISLYVLGGA